MLTPSLIGFESALPVYGIQSLYTEVLLCIHMTSDLDNTRMLDASLSLYGHCGFHCLATANNV
jgi:hypothetical protein